MESTVSITPPSWTAKGRDAATPEEQEVGSTVVKAFERSADALYRFLLFRVGGRQELAEELLQQTCCVAASHRHPPDDASACEAWLRGIARNMLRRHWRTTGRRPESARPDDVHASRRLLTAMESGPLPPEELVREENVARLMMAVIELAASDQQLVFDFYFCGRNQHQLAEALGCTTKAVEARLYRARQRLKVMLAGAEQGD